MKIAIVPGDGIGVDVTREAVKVLETVSRRASLPMEMVSFPWGADHYLKTGETVPPGAFEDFSRSYDAIFMGAFGDPRVPDMKHAADILLGARFRLDLYVNYRPVRCLDDRLCPLKDYRAADIDFAVFRENTEGAYVGSGGIFKKGTADEIAIQEDINDSEGSRAHPPPRLRGREETPPPEARHGGQVQRDALRRRPLAADLRGGRARVRGHRVLDLYIDALCMQLIKDPRQFDVIVTNNMFGDIVTDLGAALQGGLGMAASGNIHPGKVSMFEPVHGSAPKYAGTGKANPFGAILAAGLMLDHLGRPEEAAAVESAVQASVQAKQCTRDIGGDLSTSQAGDAVCQRLC